MNARLYPRNWRTLMRDAALERAGYCCEVCGAPDGKRIVNPRKKHPRFPRGKPSYVWLQMAHKKDYETWNREADTVVLCPRCHGKFDREFRRRHLAGYVPVGLAVVWVHYQGEKLLAAEARAFDDLFGTIAAFPDGVTFEVEAVCLRRVVGFGCYVKGPGGEIAVLSEEGGCLDFGRLLSDALSGVVG